MTSKFFDPYDWDLRMVRDDWFAFENVARSLTGASSGNLKGNIWFCGLESGSGLSVKHPNLVYPYPPEYYQAQTLSDFVDNFWYPESTFCQAVAKFLLTLANDDNGYAYNPDDYQKFRGKDPWRANWDWLQQKGLAGPRGASMIINAYPLSMQSRWDAKANWADFKILLPDTEHPVPLRDWVFKGEDPGSFNDYCDLTIKLRREWLSKFWHRLHFRPRLILAFSRTERWRLANLFGVADPNVKNEFLSENDKLPDAHVEWWILPAQEDLQKTLVCVLPFPHHYAGCLHNDESFTEIVREIERIFSEEMGLSLAEALKLDAYRCASKDEPGVSSYDPQDLTDFFSIVDLPEDERLKSTAYSSTFLNENRGLLICPRRHLDLSRCDEALKRIDRAIDIAESIKAEDTAEGSAYRTLLLGKRRALLKKRQALWFEHCRFIKKSVRERFLDDSSD